MLQKLIIKNVALIESVEIEFIKGLNVLSGETGAGKSVILESLNFALGAKADKSLIRSGQNECFVSVEFDVSDNENVQNLFEELDFDREDLLIITRKFTIDGKNSIKINGNTSTVSMLKKFTSLLVDVHGQSEHFELLSSSNQLKLIDKLGGNSIAILKEKIKELFAEYKSIVARIEQLGGDESQRFLRLDVLNYHINEIENASLQEGEEQELLNQRAKLQYQEKISFSLSSIKNALSDEGGAVDLISNSIRMLSQITSIDEKYNVINDRLNSLYSDLDDIADLVSSHLGDIEELDIDPDTVEDRLDLIKSLKKKYGSSIEDILTYLEKAKVEREILEDFEKNNAELEKSKQSLQDKLYSLYVDLSNERKAVAQEFCLKVINELRSLGMTKASFCVDFAKNPEKSQCLYNSANGFDDICFMFSANNGETLKPLSSVISGGEMSRFMLSIKSQSSKVNDISTFIFDEIDAGISGVVANIVAQKFAVISRDVQVLAITHLPQIASFADNNLLIEKFEDDVKTVTKVVQLDEEQKIDEIIRLVGGKESNNARELAKELIAKAVEFKNKIN